GVILELGARRRWPFRREGPNGSALHLESFARWSAPEGLSHKRGCYRCLGPPSSCALEGAFGEKSILESQTLELRGKWWLGQRRRVVCRALMVGLGHRGRPEFYSVQTSQSFFSLPRSLWPQNYLERLGVRLLNSGRAHAVRRRRGGSRRPRS
ncbi:hypothetical protein Taro_004473, partial [Colocasia esculenta]|nr:hypothetical protein [Colocasia esculenta]